MGKNFLNGENLLLDKKEIKKIIEILGYWEYSVQSAKEVEYVNQIIKKIKKWISN